MEFFTEDNTKALDAKLFAQHIAFGPIAFQAAKVLRDRGILEAILESKDRGLTYHEVSEQTGVPLYGAKVLCESGLGMGMLILNEDRFILTKTGYFILRDELTRANMDFVHDVCYEGMFFLDEAIDKGKPAGLKVFGEWPTVYEALSKLPPKVQKSWFDFDHYYSDHAFPEVLPLIFAHKPARLMDIGGNTGKWSLKCVNYDPDVKVTILDLPGQLAMAAENIRKAGFQDRVSGHPINILDASAPFPKGHDVIWMSQFLDCFSLEQIVSILKRAAEAIDENGCIYILETYWDRQKYEASSYCLQQTSLYFTCIANGNSQMFHSRDMIECLDKANLYLDEDIDGIGVSHTLFKCKKKKK
jgi:hypothetical protein